jgi:hypothetical protein
MSRVIAVLACGIALAACSMSMPSLDFLKSSPTTEVLRVESEPPGADAQTTQGQSCKTPCELAVPAGAETAISYALNGYQPQTVQIRADAGAGGARLQPNPVYAELQPVKGPAKQRSTPKRAAKKTTAAAPAASGSTAAANNAAPASAAYPWPESQPQ